MLAIELHPTDEFFKSCRILGREAGEPALKALSSALIQLKSYAWDGSLPIRPHGSSGRTFGYPFHPPYLLVFDRDTERDAGKRPVRIRLALLTIEREPR